MIWITGASTGIGASCAIEAAKLGAKLVLSARNETLLKEIKQKCLGKYHMDDQVCIKFGVVLRNSKLGRKSLLYGKKRANNDKFDENSIIQAV